MLYAVGESSECRLADIPRGQAGFPKAALAHPPECKCQAPRGPGNPESWGAGVSAFTSEGLEWQ